MNEKSTISLLKDVMHLLYPQTCTACGDPLYKGESFICLHCEYELPETKFQVNRTNKVAQLLLGRTTFESGYALYHYQRAGKLQQILKAMKYKNGDRLCFEMGKRMGVSLENKTFNSPIDCIIPLPLHPKKQKARGYNQSEELAKGLANILHLPVDTGKLIRVKDNSTQTTLSRAQRWENVSTIFETCPNSRLEDKHVLLVDDVITTGATLEASCNELNKIAGIRVSIATFALA